MNTTDTSKVGTNVKEERLVKYTSTPVSQWFYHEAKMWHPYTDTTSSKIEEFFQKQGGQGVATFDDYCFDFTKLVSFKKGASKQKHIRRGSWFFLEQGKWTPYEPQVASLLETIWQKGEFVSVQVGKDPKKMVEYKNGCFCQFEPSRANQSRPVQRGWNGQIFETVTEITTVVETVTRDSVTTGPGVAPYTKVLQPGLPIQTGHMGLVQTGHTGSVQTGPHPGYNVPVQNGVPSYSPIMYVPQQPAYHPEY